MTADFDVVTGAFGYSGAAIASELQAAGASPVTELHGSLHRVVCLSCGQQTSRRELGRRLEAANPGWDAELATLVNPDGDADLDEAVTESFQVADCSACHGEIGRAHV